MKMPNSHPALLIIIAGCLLPQLAACAPSEDFRVRMWESFMCSGLAEQAEHQMAPARKAFEAALNQLSGIRDNRRRATTLAELGGAQLALGEPAAALKTYREAVADSQAAYDEAPPPLKSAVLLQQAKSLLGLARCLSATGDLEQSVHRFDEAVSAYNRARPENRLGRDTTGAVVAEALLGKGEALAKLGQPGAAALFFKRAAFEADACAGGLELREKCMRRLAAIAANEKFPPELRCPHDGEP